MHNAGHRGVGKHGYQVPASDLNGIDLQAAGCGVHQPLQRGGDHRAGDASVGCHWATEAALASGSNPVVGHLVGAGHLAHRHQRLHPPGHRIARPRPHVAGDLGVNRQQPAVGGEPAPDPIDLITAMPRRSEVLRPILDPGDAPPSLHRQPCHHDVFSGQRQLLAESSTDVGRHHVDVGLGDAKKVGDRGPHNVRRLR